ncbi:MAG: hypothetical protein M1449_11100, partial [Candidatus Thermoplasmatota archaeon]|nr:hypothetical protein [Candidatus Thermoplasmatota archaeon]
LQWDGTVLYQSQRDDAYTAALDALRGEGAVFACTCTRSQLAHAPRNAEGCWKRWRLACRWWAWPKWVPRTC